MTTSKKKIELSKLGTQHTADHLAHFYPFLRDDYRSIKKSEINDIKVFHEFFPAEEIIDLEWLNAIYRYQQCDTRHRQISTSASTETSENE